MDYLTAKKIFEERNAVVYKNIVFEHINAIIFRKTDENKNLIQLELQEKGKNAVAIADIKDVKEK